MRNTRQMGSCGFSLLELVVSTALLLVVTTAVFELVQSSGGLFQIQAETTDMQQRLRVSVGALSSSIAAAGSGVYQGAHAGPLNQFLPSVLPYRQGRRDADPAGTYRSGTITVIQVTPGAAQTTLAQAFAAQSGLAVINRDAGCPTDDLSCGFLSGSRVLLYDGTGAYDTFTVTNTSGAVLTLQHNMRDSAKVYAAGVTKIVEAESRTFSLREGAATGGPQLVQYDGAGGADVPIADHIVGLSFSYFGDPQPPVALQPFSAATGPWTSYGPRNAADQPSFEFQPGDNCLFASSGLPLPTSRLPVLDGDGASLVLLDPTRLVDGPWCPDSTNPNRFDADLLRVRRIDVSLRVEAADAALRGPAGGLFARPGNLRDRTRGLPDREIQFALAPRNLMVLR